VEKLVELLAARKMAGGKDYPPIHFGSFLAS
jgi:hypothetical protein